MSKLMYPTLVTVACLTILVGWALGWAVTGYLIPYVFGLITADAWASVLIAAMASRGPARDGERR